MRDDLVLHRSILAFCQDFLADQVVLGAIGTTGNDLLRGRITYAGQRFELIRGRGVDVEFVAGTALRS